MLFPPLESPREPLRVVITGAGVVTPLGLGWHANAEGFRRGRSSVRPVTLFEVARQRVKTAAEVDLPEALPRSNLSPRQAGRLDRAGKLLLLAAHEAWRQAGWEPSEQLPVVLGTTGGGMSLGQDYYRQALQDPFRQRGQPRRIVHYQAQRQGLDLCDDFGFRGPVTIIANACASGANAIGHAWELLRRGGAERALAGGYDALCQLIFAGFDSLQALSPTLCRPFDTDRDGLSLGEGAAVLTLETLPYASRRGAEILGEIIGYGTANDTHHLTQPQPDGDAALAAMTAACATARVTPDQVDYLNAHGTGTPLNDHAEALAINRWAGASTHRLRVSSTKACIGHLLGAAGAVETVVCLMALREQWLPPETTLTTADPICRFEVLRVPVEARVEVTLTNSFGFGGANAALLLRRWA
jgi:3-oxoacyl-[acyl-carrier-protein] synthase II